MHCPRISEDFCAYALVFSHAVRDCHAEPPEHNGNHPRKKSVSYGRCSGMYLPACACASYIVKVVAWQESFRRGIIADGMIPVVHF